MRKITARCISLLLALVMLFGMCASAEGVKVQVKVQTPSGTMEASLLDGFDIDGCEQIIAELTGLGKLLLQSDGQALTFGSEENGYISITADDLTKALTMVMTSLMNDIPLEDVFALIEYVNSPALEADLQLLKNLLISEVNRVAAIAMNMGVIVLHQNGDMEIDVTVEQLLALATAYLNSLSNDTAALEALMDAKVFALMGMDESLEAAKGQVGAVFSMLAAKVEEASADVNSFVSGGMKLYVSVAGTMNGSYYMNMIDGTSASGDFSFDGKTATVNEYAVTDGQKAEEHYSFDGETLTYQASMNVTDDTVLSISMVAAEGKLDAAVEAKGDEGQYAGAKLKYDETGISASIDFDAEGNLVDIDFEMNQKGVSLKGKINTYRLKGTIDCVIDAKGIDWLIDFTKGDDVLYLKAKYDPATDELTVDYKETGYQYYYGNTTKKLTAELTDGEVYIDYEYKDNYNSKKINVSGSKTYRVKAAIEDRYTATTIDGSLRVKDTGFVVKGTVEQTAKTYYGNDAYVEFEFEFNAAEQYVQFTLLDKEYYYVNSLTVKLFNAGNGLGGEFVYGATNNSGEEVGKLQGSFVIEAGKVSGNGSLTANGATLPASFVFSKELIEVSVSNGFMTYKVVLKNNSADEAIKLEGALTVSSAYNPDAAQTIAQFAIDLNTETLVHDIAVSCLPLDLSATSKFDGNEFKAVVNYQGTKYEVNAKPVVTAEQAYIDANVIVNGMTVNGKIGVEQVSPNVFTFFAELTNPMGEVLTAKLPVEVEITEDAVTVKVSCEIAQGEYKMIPFDATFMVINADTEMAVKVSAVIDGETGSCEIGAKAVDENSLLFYAHASDSEESYGIEIPVTAQETESGMSLKTMVDLFMNGQKMTMAAVEVIVEYLQDNLPHVEGTPIDAATLAQMIMSFVQAAVR